MTRENKDSREAGEEEVRLKNRVPTGTAHSDDVFMIKTVPVGSF